jgi:hypothetical protein
MMEDTLFAELLASLEEGAEILAGRAQPARVTVITPVTDAQKKADETNNNTRYDAPEHGNG